MPPFNWPVKFCAWALDSFPAPHGLPLPAAVIAWFAPAIAVTLHLPSVSILKAPESWVPGITTDVSRVSGLSAYSVPIQSGVGGVTANAAAARRSMRTR